MKESEHLALKEENEFLRNQLRLYKECDPVTGLYNRKAFYQKTRDYLASHKEASYDLVCVDIEYFKLINDHYGMEQGDRLLRFLGGEMREKLPVAAGLIARLSNDVYAMCVPHEMTSDTVRLIHRIFQECSTETQIVPAIGFYQECDSDTAVSLMCDRAILALKTIKGKGLKSAAFYTSTMRDSLIEEQELMASAAAGLEKKQFHIYMQPKCNMKTGRIIGAEALVRWEHPVRGMVSPAAFIPLFERNGFIRQLDVYVWEEAVAWLKRWSGRGHSPIPISVNISRVDVFDMDLFAVLDNLVRKYGVNPSFLELEITESAYANQQENIIQAMDRLMSHGFTVLMDDFGSGYSSLNMLKDINVDVLKIDMRFLEKDDEKSKGILESVLHMSRWLNLPVIAEGVESQGQVDFLLSIGCTYAQGFFYYKPMPLEEFEALLSDPARVDYEEDGKLQAGHNTFLDFHDLFHRDMMSDRMMGNILGPIALYNYDKTGLHVIRGNEEYLRLVGRSDQELIQEKNLFQDVEEEDRPLLLEALQKAKVSEDESGAQTRFRVYRRSGIAWYQIRLFHLSERVGRDIYYGALSDVTAQMQAIEALRVSEQRFRVAMEATNIVLFELDIETREARYSEYAQRAFGLDATVSNAPEGFIEQGTVCDDSIDAFRGIYDQIYRGADKASCVIRARMDGGIVRNRITLSAIRDRSGKTVKAVGLVETVGRE